jgi:hypothetical protein
MEITGFDQQIGVAKKIVKAVKKIAPKKAILPLPYQPPAVPPARSVPRPTLPPVPVPLRSQLVTPVVGVTVPVQPVIDSKTCELKPVTEADVEIVNT